MQKSGGGGGGGIGASSDEINSWNEAARKIAAMEAALDGMKHDINGLDGPKIKADIQMLFKITSSGASKDVIDGLKEDLRRIKQELADSAYEITNTREQIAKAEKDMKKQEKDLRKDISANRAKIDTMEHALLALKKSANNEEKRKARLAEAKGSTGPSANDGAVGELEDELKLLRLDHDALAE